MKVVVTTKQAGKAISSTYWFAPGVGNVKQVMNFSGKETPFELIDFKSSKSAREVPPDDAAIASRFKNERPVSRADGPLFFSMARRIENAAAASLAALAGELQSHEFSNSRPRVGFHAMWSAAARTGSVGSERRRWIEMAALLMAARQADRPGRLVWWRSSSHQRSFKKCRPFSSRQ